MLIGQWQNVKDSSAIATFVINLNYKKVSHIVCSFDTHCDGSFQLGFMSTRKKKLKTARLRDICFFDLRLAKVDRDQKFDVSAVNQI